MQYIYMYVCATASTVSTPHHLSALGQEAAAQSTKKSSGKAISLVDLLYHFIVLFYVVMIQPHTYHTFRSICR